MVPARSQPVEAKHALPRTVVLTSFLNGAESGHPTSGSFAGKSSMFRIFDLFLKRSPALRPCRWATVHLLHDVPRDRLSVQHRNRANSLGRGHGSRLEFLDNDTSVWHYKGAWMLHYFAPNPHVPPADIRWSHGLELLTSRLPHWDCAWMVDISDVAVLRVPRCSQPALASRLAISSDVCSPGVKRWLASNADTSRARLRADASFRAFVDKSSGRGTAQAPLWQHGVRNTGIIGGRREVLLPALQVVSAQLAQHHGSQPKPPHLSVDMVVWNAHLLGRAVVTGYPNGPVNLPMWGKLAVASPWCHAHRHPLNASLRCSEACKIAFANESLHAGRFWFSHKLEEWWVRMNAKHLDKALPSSERGASAAPGSRCAAAVLGAWDSARRRLPS